MSVYKYMLDTVIGLDENKNYQFILTDNNGDYVGKKEGVTGTGTGYNINPDSVDWGSSGDSLDLVLDWAGSSVEIVNEQSDERKVGTIACYVEYDAAWRFLGYADFKDGGRLLGPDEAIEFSSATINIQQSFDPPDVVARVTAQGVFEGGFQNSAVRYLRLVYNGTNDIVKDINGNNCEVSDHIETTTSKYTFEENFAVDPGIGLQVQIDTLSAKRVHEDNVEGVPADHCYKGESQGADAGEGDAHTTTTGDQTITYDAVHDSTFCD